MKEDICDLHILYSAYVQNLYQIPLNQQQKDNQSFRKGVYSFPMAIRTNYHKLSDLKMTNLFPHISRSIKS